MAVDQARLLALLGRRGALPSRLRPALLQFLGLSQVVTAPDAVEALLAESGVTVPYGPRSTALGLGAFPLALDGPPHGTANERVRQAIAATDGAHNQGVAVARALAEARVQHAGGRLEVVGGLVEPALSGWVGRWFGLPDLVPDLLRAGRVILHATFLNPPVPAGAVDAEGLQWAVEWLDARRPTLAAAVETAPDDTLAGTLRASMSVADAVDHLLGLTVGPLALGTWALAEVVDELLGTPWVLDSIVDDEGGQDAYATALARRPPLPGVLRDVHVERSLETSRGTVVVPPGRVLVATACARHLPVDDVAPDRSFDLVFGSGPHACLGRAQVTEVSGVVLRALGVRSPRRVRGPGGLLAPGAGPSGLERWPFPGRLDVSLLR